MNKPKLLHFSYKRYLINFLRDNLSLEGTPVHILARGKGERIEDESIELLYT
jgi:GTP-binding protein